MTPSPPRKSELRTSLLVGSLCCCALACSGSSPATTSGSGGDAIASGGTTGSGGSFAGAGGTDSGGTIESGGQSGSGGGKSSGGTSGTGGTGAGGTAGTTRPGGSGGTPGKGGASESNDAAPDADSPADLTKEATTRDVASDAEIRDLGTPDQGQADRGADLVPDSGSSTCNLTGGATAQTPTVYVIGDSTASVYASDLYPRMGWAQPLQDFFAPACATLADKALSGRSSKSFYDEGNWTPIRNSLRQGDYVLIQFGHNDEKTEDAARGTDPYTTFQHYLSIYLDDTQAKGAVPILLTPINRNNWSGSTLKDTHGEYPAATRQLAQTRKVSLVDTTALTKTYFERIGQAATTALFLNLDPGEFPNYPNGNSDNTHLQEKGARIVAQMVLADLYRQGLAPGTLAKTAPQPP